MKVICFCFGDSLTAYGGERCRFIDILQDRGYLISAGWLAWPFPKATEYQVRESRETNLCAEP